LTRYKAKPIDSVGYYRRALMIGRLPTPVRRMLWWMSLNFSGLKRAKRMGTFGITSYGVLGAESLHPISPLTCTFNFGPIGKDGTVLIKIIYDHRTLDGSEVARRLRDIETALLTEVRAELLAMSVVDSETDGADNTQNRQIRQDAMHQAQKPNLGLERAAQTDETPV